MNPSDRGQACDIDDSVVSVFLYVSSTFSIVAPNDRSSAIRASPASCRRLTVATSMPARRESAVALAPSRRPLG